MQLALARLRLLTAAQGVIHTVLQEIHTGTQTMYLTKWELPKPLKAREAGTVLVYHAVRKMRWTPESVKTGSLSSFTCKPTCQLSNTDHVEPQEHTCCNSNPLT